MQQKNRPHGISFNVTNGVIKNMKLEQPIAWSVSLNGAKNLHVHNNRIHAVSITKVSINMLARERSEVKSSRVCL
jgi:hypothetical protein